MQNLAQYGNVNRVIQFLSFRTFDLRLYYISNISLGVDVLRGITLSTWFNKYSIDLLVGSSAWVSRDRLGEVSWR